MKSKDSIYRNFATNHFKLFEQIPGAWGCKDRNSVIIYANYEYSQLVGLSNSRDMIGRTDFDMPFETVNCANLFRAQDRKVIETGKRLRILDIHPFASLPWKAYVVTKTPLKNNQGQIIGTIFHAENMTDIHTFEIGTFIATQSLANKYNYSLEQNSYFYNSTFSCIKLSKRQSEVLFFLLRGNTVKQIARILDISNRTVDEYLKELKSKFDVQNKNELINKAIQHGFLNMIPESLFNIQLSMELEF